MASCINESLVACILYLLRTLVACILYLLRTLVACILFFSLYLFFVQLTHLLR